MKHKAMDFKKVVAAVTLTLAVGVTASPTSTAQTTEIDGKSVYSSADAWLCRPGRQDACAMDQTATVISADGKLTQETFTADPDAAVDCFYVYPTVSLQATGNSDLVVEPEEKNAVLQQFARFGSKCRLFAPMYRQVTIPALLAQGSSNPLPIDRELAYRDVAAAWSDYLARDNQGRGVILIGHSQGSFVLMKLIQNEIDGKPLQNRIISVLLMGPPAGVTGLPVPNGADVGGAFQHIPVCHSNSQIGCVIAFNSFRSEAPPPAGSRFVKAPDGMHAVCANPAALGGGSGALDAYLSTSNSFLYGSAPRTAWTNPPQAIDTAYVKVPGLLSAECVTNEHGTYLAVTVHSTPGGSRSNTISGDVISNGKVLPDWGLHMIDANLTMGNLVATVGEQSKAYLAEVAKKHD